MITSKEVKRMTNKEAAALIEAIKIIHQLTRDKPEEMEKALEAIQSQLKTR